MMAATSGTRSAQRPRLPPTIDGEAEIAYTADVGMEEFYDGEIATYCAAYKPEDLDEILALSDRIAVIYEGQVMDIVPRENATPEKLGLLMAGVHPEDQA